MTCCMKLRQLADEIRASCYMDSTYDPFDDLKSLMSNRDFAREAKQCTGNCAKSHTFPTEES